MRDTERKRLVPSIVGDSEVERFPNQGSDTKSLMSEAFMMEEPVA